jgi:hypothetical protein
MQNMKPLNLSIIEKFTEKVKIAEKSNQRSVNLDIKESLLLKDTIDQLVLKLLEKNINSSNSSIESSTVKADGGKF